uniref:Putative lipocalin n=1 Tax=Rhipicephalus microplus TaxID=6941 RepID=A0A6G5A017_RHIMP
MLNLAIFLVLGASAALSEALTSNISYALEPKGRTYVYSTLHSDKNHSCASYRKYTIQCPYYHCFYYVLYTYETNSAKEKLWHYGELQRPCRHDDYKNYSCLLSMNISTFNTTGKVDEPERKVLMYWNENIGCGVYIVLVNETKAGCELHSRDGAQGKAELIGDLQTCHSEFHKHCQEYTQGNDYMTRCNMQGRL